MRPNSKSSFCSFIFVLVFSALYALTGQIEMYLDGTWVGELFALVATACNVSDLFNCLLLVAIVATAFIVGKAIYCGKGSVTRCIGYGFLIV